MRARVGFLIVTLVSTVAHAERGHQAYEDMIKAEQLRRMHARIDAAYSCKRRGTPLVRIEHAPTTDDAGSVLVMYRGGAVELDVGETKVEACVPRRTNDWIRWRLANVTWRTGGNGDCDSDSVTTRYDFAGRERYAQCAHGKTLSAKDRDRLGEVEAALVSAIRK